MKQLADYKFLVETLVLAVICLLMLFKNCEWMALTQSEQTK